MTVSPKKVALVTGDNKSIEVGIARELGKAGMTVLLSARNPSLGPTGGFFQQSGTYPW